MRIIIIKNKRIVYIDIIIQMHILNYNNSSIRKSNSYHVKTNQVIS